MSIDSARWFPAALTPVADEQEVNHMAEEKKKKKCEHPSCNCTVAEDEKYCSEYCANARDVLEIGCGCEHPECR